MPYNRVPSETEEFGQYTTGEPAETVLNRAHNWRMGTDGNVVITVMRMAYHEPFKSRLHFDTLTCADGEKLYRLTMDGKPILYSDEEEFGGWMTYDQLLCYMEGYNRLTNLERFTEGV